MWILSLPPMGRCLAFISNPQSRPFHPSAFLWYLPLFGWVAIGVLFPCPLHCVRASITFLVQLPTFGIDCSRIALAGSVCLCHLMKRGGASLSLFSFFIPGVSSFEKKYYPLASQAASFLLVVLHFLLVVPMHKDSLTEFYVCATLLVIPLTVVWGFLNCQKWWVSFFGPPQDEGSSAMKADQDAQAPLPRDRLPSYSWVSNSHLPVIP